jgi:hypothetical protein
VLLCGCPYSSSYAIDESPTIYVEDILTGNWAAFVTKPDEKKEPIKMVLSKRSDREYNIAFTGYLKELKPWNVIVNDSIKGTAFMSTVAGKQFLNIEIKARTYIAELQFKNNTISLLPLSDHFTSKIIQSTAALRGVIEYHYKTRTSPLYDEEFCLRDMVKVN